MIVRITTPDYRKGYEDGLREAARIAREMSTLGTETYCKCPEVIADTLENRAKELSDGR